jgi:hypothetical protein
VQLAREERGGFAVHFNQGRALLIFFALFGGAFARSRNRDATFFGDSAHGFGERGFFQLHHELEDVAAFAAAETVVDLLGGVNRERGSFFLMERAKTGEILARLFEAHVFADDADDVRLLLYTIRETSRFCHRIKN